MYIFVLDVQGHPLSVTDRSMVNIDGMDVGEVRTLERDVRITELG